MTKRRTASPSKVPLTKPEAQPAEPDMPGVSEVSDVVEPAGDGVPDSGYTVPDAGPPGLAAGEAGEPAVGARQPARPGGPLDIAITIGGLVVVVLLAAALALFEGFLAPLRVSDLGLSSTGGNNMRIPLALVLALVTNPLLVWFAFVTTGRLFAALLPAGVWTVLWFLAAAPTTERDLLITNDNWVGLTTLFAGPIVFAIAVYVLTLRARVAASANSKATPLAPQSVGQVDTFPHRP